MIGTLLEKLFVSVGVDLSGFGSEMAKASAEVGKLSNDLKRDFASVGDSWKTTGQGMMKAGAVMTGAITAPLAIFGKQAAQAAIDAEEMQSAFEVVFGNMAGDVRQWAEETGNAMGRSTQEIQRGALAFQELFGKALDPAKAAEMSKQFAVLTQDLASFKNLSNEAAQQKLFSGLTGEAEPLRAVGVFLNEAAVAAKGAELGLGKVSGELTDQEKIIARAALIREQLAKADGDVMRTSDSTANRIRASQAAYEELSITVGATLIPAITPLIGIITDMLEGFNQLDPGVQSFIVGAAGIAAVIGPVVAAVGAITTGIGALMPIIGAAIPILSGIAGALGGLALAFWPVTLAVGAVVAAWVYWDEITAIVGRVGVAVSDFYSAHVKPTVDLVMAALQPLADFFSSVFGAQIRGTIEIISALLKGDFVGAWAAAKEMIAAQLTAMAGLFVWLKDSALASIGALVGGIKDWIVGKLAGTFDWLKGKLEAVGKWFFDLYDAVVGHSYIPDMVDGIGQNMARLEALMVDPARKATASTKEAFRGLASDVAGILDRLFPLQAQLKSVMEDIAKLDAARRGGLLDAATYEAARGELTKEATTLRTEASPIQVVRDELEPVTSGLGDLSGVLAELPRVASEAELALQDFGERLGDGIMGAIRDVLSGRGSLNDVARNMLSRFFERTITDALKSLEGAIFGEGGLGGFLGGLFSSVISGRAVGGPVVPGRAYTVGSGEAFVPSQSGRVLSRNDAMSAMGGTGGGLARISVTVSGARGNAEIMEMVSQGVQQGLGQYDRVVGSRVNTNLKRRA